MYIWVSINEHPYSINSGYLLFFESTIMGNTADLSMVQKMITDTLHKESKSQRVITERGGFSRSAVSKHIKCKVDWKEEIGYEKVHKQQGWPQAWKYCQTKLMQTLGRASQGVNWSWSQCIKSLHAQTSSVWSFHSQWWFGLPCHLLVLVHCVFLKSTVKAAIYQEILEHFMLPSADKLYEDADFIFQQDLAPVHTAKGAKSWFNDHGVTVLDWPANSPDLNPIENIWVIVKRKMRDTRPNNTDDLKAAIKATWASLHLSSATGCLSSCHAALMQSFMQKEDQPSIEWIEMNILFRSLTFLFKMSFFYWKIFIFLFNIWV